MHLLTSQEINKYSELHSTAESAVLAELNRQTHLRTELPVMLSGHLQGRLLSMISCMLKPTNILEIGTFTGYSAICLAEGLSKGGKIISIDMNDELQELAHAYFEQANLSHCIELKCGKAAEIIPTLSETFDLIFIDADKVNYSLYYDLVIDKLKVGGCLLADNVLYHGEVIDLASASKNAKAMHAYNEKIVQDNRMESVLLPIRDGIMLSRKK